MRFGDNTVLYNSLAMIDADGEILGVYRKTHIPDDHFYQEKFYFTPGIKSACGKFMRGRSVTLV